VRVPQFLAATSLVLMSTLAPALADKRVALVVGNATYRHADKLANPVNDARGMRDALKNLGFDVIYGENLDLKGLGRAIGQFAGRVEDADVAMVYFAGHGSTFDGTSYVVPVDAEFASLTEVPHELVPVETLIDDLRRAKGVRIAILDACRDNGAEQDLKRSRSGAVTRGLAPMKNASGLIIAYATQYGATAADDAVAPRDDLGSATSSSTRHSPFTSALLSNIATPDLDVKDMLYKVGRDVIAATGGRQRPEISISMYDQYALVSGNGGGGTPSLPSEHTNVAVTLPARPTGLTGPAERAPVAEKAVLYEEDPANPNGTQFIGTAIWRTERTSPADGQTREVAIRADIEIPVLKLSVRVSVHRNYDKQLPASHTAEITFAVPRDFSHPGIADVPGIMMKQSATARGVVLNGARVKVADNYFLVGLSSTEADMKHNVGLLKGDAWLDIPIVYGDGKRALLTIEKGPPGEHAFSEAFAAWQQPVVHGGDQCSGPVTVSFPSQCAAPLTAVQERGLKPKDGFRECENCPEMVVVPAGSFTMGSPEWEKDRTADEGPQHIVTIRKAFAVGKLHVTVDQFAVFVHETAYEPSRSCHWSNPGFAQEGSHPVVCMSWDDANAYANWLAEKTGRPYRLLSEAEWEYAARGEISPGAYRRFWFGNDERELCRYGNFADQKHGVASASCNDGYDRTSPAGHYAPNDFGLHDMAGNAWQWTADCYHNTYNGAPTDGSAWTGGICNGRVVRGGSWNDGPWVLPAARRRWYTVELPIVGFRLARTLVP
jgi:formylglycine-generating enzyme required for sulfatase activity